MYCERYIEKTIYDYYSIHLKTFEKLVKGLV